MMTNKDYFKRTFLTVAAGLFAGTFVYGAFEIDFSNISGISKLFIRSLVTSVLTGFVMGILNMFFKFGSFQRKKSEQLD